MSLTVEHLVSDATATATAARAPSDHPLRAGTPLSRDAFARVRRALVLDGCKWDPQVEDVATLAPFPLLIRRAQWRRLCHLAESLAAELAAAERELLSRPRLHRTLAIPRRLRRALRAARRDGQTPAAARVLRFDFHWTRDGWRISEVNSDVPGGFSEASAFTRAVAADSAEGARGAVPSGDAASALADALTEVARAGGNVALLVAPGFMEDQQVVSYLARRLAERGVTSHLCDPSHLHWQQGRAHLRCAWREGRIDAVVRFYQAEWLARLPRRCRWRELFTGGRTPVTNPGSAVLTESKRFPLTWDLLRTPLPTWRRLLPETRDPRDAPWRRDDGWLIKTALCNTGDTVIVRELATPKIWRGACRDAWLRPGQWLAQRRFETAPVATAAGDVFPCIGVYTIDGRACGAYVRVSPRPVIDYRAVDVALLVEDGPDDRAGVGRQWEESR